MGFDYGTRDKFEKQYFEKWQKDNKEKIKKVDSTLFEEAMKIGPSYDAYNKTFTNLVDVAYAEKSYAKPSDFMKDKLNDLVHAFVPEEYVEDYYSIVDEFSTFQYTRGYDRRSFRTRDFSQHLYHAIKLMYTYMSFGIFTTSVAGFIKDEMSEEQIDFKRNRENTYGKIAFFCMDDVIAARINAGDEAVISAIREAILSENNTVIVTRSMISAIVKSKNPELHELLGKFLVAARLSEGVRQVICECADEGRLDSFVTILKVIDKENLVRFAAVKRAFAVWTGFMDENNIDRIIGKAMPLMLSSIEDMDAARELLRTDDSIQIMLGLWALAANDVQFAMDEMERIAREGSHVQKLTISYFNTMLQNASAQNASFKSKIASYVVETNEDDLELIGAFMSTYLNFASSMVQQTFKQNGKGTCDAVNNFKYEYFKIPCTELFPSDTDGSITRRHYEILKKNLAKMEKKTKEFTPFIFPWHSMTISKNDFVMRMAVMAYALEDEAYIDETCQMLTDIDVSSSYNRRYYLRMLLHDPQNEMQRKVLLSAICDREEYTRGTAYMILRDMSLRKDDYVTLTSFLKYKNEETRKYVMNLLKKQDRTDIAENIKTLLKAKNENMRLAGFDLLKTEFAEDQVKALQIVDESGIKDSLTEQEKVLFDEIAGEKEEELTKETGYGIYDVNASLVIPSVKPDAKKVRDYFDISKEELDKEFLALNDFFLTNSNLEYKNANGETALLANGIYLTTYENVGGGRKRYSDIYPFKELWQKYYEENIHSQQKILVMQMALYTGYGEDKIEDYSGYVKLESELVGKAIAEYKLPDFENGSGNRNKYRDMQIIVNIMVDLAEAKIPRNIALAACEYMAEIPEEKRWFIEPEIKKTNIYIIEREREYRAFTNSEKMYSFIRCLLDSNEKKEAGDSGCNPAEKGQLEPSQESKNAIFAEKFCTLRRLDLAYEYQKHENVMWYNRPTQKNILSIYPCILACIKKVITKDYLYKYIFEELPFEETITKLGIFTGADLGYYDHITLAKYCKAAKTEDDAEEIKIGDNLVKIKIDTENPYYKLGRELYDTISNLILNVELKRGDSETEFSKASKRLKRVFGMNRLGEILTVLGNDTLDRNTYYCYGNGTGKKECLSHLLAVCYPLDTDRAADLKKIKVSEERLIEVAMYAPQWIELIEEHLGYEGFKSGCYYFMAHMNERFDDKKKAIIAKYTPLSSEELNDGAFDLNWFFESYNKLGEKKFQKLYRAAKYISDGAKHARARKYADAALGKVDRDELEVTIADKRNKDLLMSYGIIPVKDAKDSLHRYEFIQKFLKESRQFGAQRRASEQKSCEMALKNLATASGYADSLRLVLAMETALIEENAKFFDGITVDEYIFKVLVSEDGKAELSIEKAGKKIKSLPAAFKKNETVLEIKEFVTKLKDQYSRAVKMFENAMEEREEYGADELSKLCKNPVLKAILTKLVYVKNGEFYLINSEDQFMLALSGENITETAKNGVEALKASDKVRIAHPYDMYVNKRWSELQTLVFNWASAGKKYQPFKQVFRELYVKLSEEEDAYDSRMFAGNQIQPKKTVATLKNRRWIADYENGLQKIYYKDNIIATIYAMADWFSPSEEEEPTLEYVSFYDRKTFKQKKLSEIPEIVYSEVMRDVDLAVSVAHAGGVDPETSHSTIELRKTIIEFNLKLFNLENVRLEGTHALISGTYGEYSIHLGSGVIHKIPGTAINVLPVHSQNRGKIFLPFIDEDPKTAEIMSKILLFAEDQKIKDPFIMNQILG